MTQFQSDPPEDEAEDLVGPEEFAPLIRRFTRNARSGDSPRGTAWDVVQALQDLIEDQSINLTEDQRDDIARGAVAYLTIATAQIVGAVNHLLPPDLDPS